MVISNPVDNELKSAILHNHDNSFGNNILYDMCRSGDMLDANKLGDEIWLIGRSYAASPERRFSEREGELSRGRGTGDYFGHIAETLVKDEKYIKLCDNIQNILDLNFDSSEQDYYVISSTIQCIQKLNECIKIASEKFDRSHNKDIDFQNTEYKNQISFCSKFLHFQKPQSFFIIDQYTMEGAKQLFVPACKKEVSLYTQVITKEVRESFKAKLITSLKGANITVSQEDEVKKYILHVKRSYALGCILKDIETEFTISKGANISYPRLTDIIFQSIV